MPVAACAVVRAVVDGARRARLCALIDARYRAVDAARPHGAAAVAALLPPRERFAPTASSLTLGAALPPDDVRALLAEVVSGPAGPHIAAALGGPARACDLDQAWVRRQYAPARSPAGHAPHGWHQDGGLGFDYLAYAGAPAPGDGLLRMATCWIALDPCGVSAPGLELVGHRLDTLLPVDELTDARIRARFAAADVQRPALGAGDALVFAGDVVHRTYVVEGMTADRTSVELRFFAADDPPARLAGDRFVRVDARRV